MQRKRLTKLVGAQTQQLSRENFLAKRANGSTSHTFRVGRLPTQKAKRKELLNERQLSRMALVAFSAEQARAGNVVAPELKSFIDSSSGRKLFAAKLAPLRALPKTRAEVHKRLLVLKRQIKQVRPMVSGIDKRIALTNRLVELTKRAISLSIKYGEFSTIANAYKYWDKNYADHRACLTQINELAEELGLVNNIKSKIIELQYTTIMSDPGRDFFNRLQAHARKIRATLTFYNIPQGKVGKLVRSNGMVEIWPLTPDALKVENGKFVKELDGLADMIQAQLRAEKSKQKAAYALAQPAEKETKFLKTFATGEKELSDKELGTIYDYYKEQAQKSA